MTLQNGLICRDKAYLWTDEGYFDGTTGKLLFLDSKALKSLTWPFAVSTSSNGGNPHEILASIGEAAPSDLSSLLLAVSEALVAYAAQGFIASVLIAAWEGEPRLFLASTLSVQDEPAFKPFEILHHVCSGNGLPEYHEAIATGLTPQNMAKVIDAQLVTPIAAEGPMGAIGKQLWFGGGIVQIEVSRSGVTERVLRTIPTAETA